jgi:hypothetical protein
MSSWRSIYLSECGLPVARPPTSNEHSPARSRGASGPSRDCCLARFLGKASSCHVPVIAAASAPLNRLVVRSAPSVSYYCAAYLYRVFAIPSPIRRPTSRINRGLHPAANVVTRIYSRVCTPIANRLNLNFHHPPPAYNRTRPSCNSPYVSRRSCIRHVSLFCNWHAYGVACSLQFTRSGPFRDTLKLRLTLTRSCTSVCDTHTLNDRTTHTSLAKLSTPPDHFLRRCAVPTFKCCKPYVWATRKL